MDVTGCPVCGTRAIGHGRAPTKVRDLPVAGRPAVFVWHKRRWRCPERDCEATTWSETCPEIAPRASLTARARARLAEMVNVGSESIAGAAAAFGVGWHIAHQAVIEHTDPVVDDPGRLERVTAIGVDEKRFLNATPEHRTVFTTQIVDLDRHRLLDVIEGRSRDVVAAWLAERGEAWCDQILLATLDPAAGYRRGLLDHLDHATLVVDHFHAIKLANTAIDDIRRRVQQDTTGHRGRKGDPLYRIRRALLVAADKLTPDRFDWIRAALDAGRRRMGRQRAPEGHILGRRPCAREAAADRVLPVLRRRRRARAAPARAHRRPVAHRDPRLPLDVQSLQRPGREHPHARREDPPQRPRLHQPRQLPTPPTRPPRRAMAHCPHPTNSRPSTTAHRVEPSIASLAVASSASSNETPAVDAALG
jgi:hypothetical protein